MPVVWKRITARYTTEFTPRMVFKNDQGLWIWQANRETQYDIGTWKIYCQVHGVETLLTMDEFMGVDVRLPLERLRAAAQRSNRKRRAEYQTPPPTPTAVDDPPAPPLVGVELNPGPPRRSARMQYRSAAAAPVPRAATNVEVNRDKSLVSAFRDDLIEWLQVNRLKQAGELDPSHAARTMEIWRMHEELQLVLYMRTLDQTLYGRMPYRVYRALLAEFDTILGFVVASQPSSSA